MDESERVDAELLIIPTTETLNEYRHSHCHFRSPQPTTLTKKKRSTPDYKLYMPFAGPLLQQQSNRIQRFISQLHSFNSIVPDLPRVNSRTSPLQAPQIPSATSGRCLLHFVHNNFAKQSEQIALATVCIRRLAFRTTFSFFGNLHLS